MRSMDFSIYIYIYIYVYILFIYMYIYYILFIYVCIYILFIYMYIYYLYICIYISHSPWHRHVFPHSTYTLVRLTNIYIYIYLKSVSPEERIKYLYGHTLPYLCLVKQSQKLYFDLTYKPITLWHAQLNCD